MKKFQRLILVVLALVLVCVPLLQTDASAAGKDGYLSLEEAGAQLRDYMVARGTGELIIKLYLKDDRQLINSQVLDLLQVEAIKHTGVGKEGDTLRWCWNEASYDMEDDFNGKEHYITLKISSAEYYSTAAQEKELDTKVKQILEELDLSGKSDRDKIFAIYDYVCKNVKYSDAYLTGEYARGSAGWDFVHSAYGALVKGEAVCQGFVSAMYRLLLDAGIDNRIISGDSHGWNIVKLGDQYYCLDSTWDSDTYHLGDGDYKWFLKGASDFWNDGHTTDPYCAKQEFVEKYPISALDYGAEPTSTGSGKCGDNATWTLTADGILTISGSGAIWDSGTYSYCWTGLNGYIKKIVIESGITSIGAYVFYNCQEVTSVSIPDTVTYIGFGAFGLCGKLQKIVIPNSVTEIEGSAFAHCWRLKDVTLSANLKAISSRMFMNCIDLKTVTIPGSVKTIDEMAFCACLSLETVTIPNSVTKIGNGAFSSAFDPEAGASIVIPESVTEVGETCFSWSGIREVTWNAKTEKLDTWMFYLCYYLEKVTLSDSITSFGDEVFMNCNNLSAVVLPSGLTQMGKNTFANCYSLTSIVLPDGLTSIPQNTFLRCKNLEKIDISDAVTFIGNGAFEKCVKLKEVTIPASVKRIDQFAFGFCDSMDRVIFLGDPPEVDDNPFSSLSGMVLYYPADNSAWTPEAIKEIISGSANMDSAGYRQENGHRRAYGWVSDDTAHWYPCLDCDDKTNVTAHEYDLKCDTDCNVCGHIRTADHEAVPKYDAVSHWYECACTWYMGGYEEHIYDDNCDTTCDICGYVRMVFHDYAIRKWDETHHWLECACGKQDGYTEHWYSWGSMVCEGCGYDDTASCTHFYNGNCDATCDWCGEEREAPHNFSYSWDMDHHWLACRCGLTKEGKEVHTWSNGNCTACGTAGGPTQSEPTEPAPTQPAPTEPAPTEPAPTEPAPTEPAPTAPAPTEPAPTEPAPTKPAPTEPAPTETAPTETAPTEPAPTEPAPTAPAPTAPAPTETAPTEPAPTESAPMESAPTETAPMESAPTETAPTESAPTEPAPTEPTQTAGTSTSVEESSAATSEETIGAIEPDDVTEPNSGAPAAVWIAAAATVMAGGGAAAGIIIKKRKMK